MICSYAQAVEFGGAPVLIGERINPTGKPRLKEALRAGDMDYVLRLAVEQQEKGARVLDVNVGLPEVDETALLLRAVEELQAVTDLPLQLDSSSPDALEAAMRRYNGRPLVNSVNGKAESMAALFPLLKKYGGVAIALTLDEDGIPATAEGRLAIARRIVDTAAGYGIPREDLIFDPLAPHHQRRPERRRRHPGDGGAHHPGAGLPAPAWGYPTSPSACPGGRRSTPPSCCWPWEKGLSAAILNPGSAPMLEALSAFRALRGLDPNCRDYIAAMAGAAAPAPAPAPAAGMDLAAAVERGP